MRREECLRIVEEAQERGEAANLSRANLSEADLREANLRAANLGRADLHGADLRWVDLGGANLHGADLSGADLDFAAWPLWCGGTLAKLDRRLSLQLIYHVFNQEHQDPEILAALEPLRGLAQEFRDCHHPDAPTLRPVLPTTH
jgi:hypothetical protein